ncbi:hypothetical protein [Meridianimarinicoccus aquatilis]|nr:hypothetical protein [Fluviibacterium aquatile]
MPFYAGWRGATGFADGAAKICLIGEGQTRAIAAKGAENEPLGTGA